MSCVIAREARAAKAEERLPRNDHPWEPQTTYHLIGSFGTGAQRGWPLLRRWATVGRSPESEFLIAIIAQAIEDKATWDRSSGLPVTFAPSFMASAIPAYCACIGVDPRSFAGAVQQSVCYGGRMTFPIPRPKAKPGKSAGIHKPI